MHTLQLAKAAVEIGCNPGALRVRSNAGRAHPGEHWQAVQPYLHGDSFTVCWLSQACAYSKPGTRAASKLYSCICSSNSFESLSVRLCYHCFRANVGLPLPPSLHVHHLNGPI